MPPLALILLISRIWHDNFLSFALQLNKDGTLYKSPPKSHVVPNPARPASDAGASKRKKQRPSLVPLPLFGKRKTVIASCGTVAVPSAVASLDSLRC